MLARRGRAPAPNVMLWRAAGRATTPVVRSFSQGIRVGAWRALAPSTATLASPLLSSAASWRSAVHRNSQASGIRFFSQELHDEHDEYEEMELTPEMPEHDRESIQERRRERQENRDNAQRILEDLEDSYLERLYRARGDSRDSAGWMVAMDIYDEIQENDGYGLSKMVASGLIELLGLKKRMDECLHVLAYSREQGVRPRIHSYSSAIGCCYKQEEFMHALRVFEVMRNDGYVPQAVTYSHALTSALKSGQHELVLEIFDDMLANRVETSIVIYNNILNSCARVGDVQSSLGVLQAIRQRGIRMTQSTFHSLAICAGKTGKWELALDAMSTMQEEGFTPTMTIFNSVFTACAKGKRWETVVDVYNVMPEDLRHDLRGVYLGAVVMAHAKSSSEEMKQRAIDIFNEYKDREAVGERPNLFACNAVLWALLDLNRLAEVHTFAHDMKRHGFKWDTMTYQCVTLAFIRGGAVDTAVQMLHRNAKRMDKSTQCYRELIEFYAEKRKDPREACRLSMQMMMNNKRLSRMDWNNALRHALQLPERAPYWNFRKWMRVRAKHILDDVPKNLWLPDYREERKLLQEQELKQQKQPQAQGLLQHNPEAVEKLKQKKQSPHRHKHKHKASPPRKEKHDDDKLL